MPVRSLSRALTSSVAAGALTLAVSGTALAMPARPFCDCAGPGAAQSAAQSKPVPQQAPTWPVSPQTLTPPRAAAPSANAGFQWADAGIGAGGALVVVLAGLGGTLALRRRHVSDPPLPA